MPEVVREKVALLVERGPRPHELDIAEVDLAMRSELLDSIDEPVTDSEARLLFDVLGTDDCFGLAWTVVSLVESSPNWPLAGLLWDEANPWHQRLCSRIGLRTGAGG